MKESTAKKRNANMELLRLLSMLMIVMLHALGKSNLLVNLYENRSANAFIAWALESLSLCAVNVFILISGYYLINSKFKLGRLIELIAEMIFYSLGTFLVCYIFGVDIHEEINTYFLLHTVFPVHMKLFWFLTAYLFVYMLLPVISAGVKAISQEQFKTVIIILLIFECGFKSFLPFRFEEDEFGYNLLWFLTVFLIGAYLKLYSAKLLNKAHKGLIVYFVSCALILFEKAAIEVVYVKTGHLQEIQEVSAEYNHIFVLLSAIGLFTAFVYSKPVKESVGRIICALSPMALGVYLLHENLSLRYNWQKWAGIYESLQSPTAIFVCRILVTVIVVFIAGLIVDFIRIQIFKLCKNIFAKKHET
ncbi:MAG: acyltransferase [Lachnospiraceae bacterium]|nr:acyltransferase [Lachnospiraceae bacterium]